MGLHANYDGKGTYFVPQDRYLSGYRKYIHQ